MSYFVAGVLQKQHVDISHSILAILIGKKITNAYRLLKIAPLIKNFKKSDNLSRKKL